MRARDIVRHRETGAVGVVLDTINISREDGPLSVIFDDSGVAHSGIREADFEVVGKYDAVPDEKGCGMGKREKCCRFLGYDTYGLTCLRFGSMHWSMVFKSGQLRDPHRNYPNCKLTE
jgi:hypothetical protein